MVRGGRDETQALKVDYLLSKVAHHARENDIW